MEREPFLHDNSAPLTAEEKAENDAALRAVKMFFLSVVLTTAIGFTAWGFGSDVRTSVGCASATLVACIVAAGFTKDGKPE